MTPEQIQLVRDALPVVGTVLGAVVGAAGGAVGTWLVARAETTRQSERLAFELGMREWETNLKFAVDHGGRLYPPVSFIHAYVELLELARSNRLTPERVKAALERTAKVSDLIEEFNVERKSQKRS